METNSINGINTQMGQMGMKQAADSYIRNIQNQIASAQKQLQELQQQINDLNMQLRQYQTEQRREKQQKQSSFDDMTGGLAGKDR